MNLLGQNCFEHQFQNLSQLPHFHWSRVDIVYGHRLWRWWDHRKSYNNIISTITYYRYLSHYTRMSYYTKMSVFSAHDIVTSTHSCQKSVCAFCRCGKEWKVNLSSCTGIWFMLCCKYIAYIHKLLKMVSFIRCLCSLTIKSWSPCPSLAAVW